MPDMNAGILEEIEDQNLSAASGDGNPTTSVITICGPTVSLVHECGMISFTPVITCVTCE